MSTKTKTKQGKVSILKELNILKTTLMSKSKTGQANPAKMAEM